jgi:hypothetical protein
MKQSRSFILAIACAVMACFSFLFELPMRIAYLVAEDLTPQKLDVELAQNVAHKVTDCRKPVSIGSDSDESALSFVSMLKAINSRSLSAAA